MRIHSATSFTIFHALYERSCSASYSCSSRLAEIDVAVAVNTVTPGTASELGSAASEPSSIVLSLLGSSFARSGVVKSTDPVLSAATPAFTQQTAVLYSQKRV